MFEWGLVSRRLTQSLHFVFQLELFALEAKDLGVVYSGTGYCSFDLLVEVAVLLCEFSKVRGHCHQFLHETFLTVGW